MSWPYELLAIGAVMAVLLMSGAWTAFALSAGGLVLVLVHSGTGSLPALGSVGWNANASFVLTAVPLFILMGQVILVSGVSSDFFRGIDYWLRRVPGGLYSGSVVACAVLSATISSSVATAAAVGSVAVPNMRERRYNMPFAGGTLAAGGSLGILIPPSIALILYSALTNVPVTDLFAAALIPGLALCLLFLVYVAVRTWLDPTLVGERPPALPHRQKLRALLAMLPVFFLVTFVVGAIYLGVATPTEAGALGALGAVLVSVHKLSVRALYDSIIKTVEISVMVLAILLGAQIILFALIDSGLSLAFTDWVVSLGLSQTELLIAISILYIVLGDFVEGIGMMLLTLPLLLPIVSAAGIDLLWFGVVVVLLVELGQITPPVGLNLFVIRGFDDQISHGQIVKSSLPFVGLMIGMIALLKLFPDIALWLPGQTRQSPL